MWNNIYTKMKQWLIVAKQWLVVAKQWLVVAKQWLVVARQWIITYKDWVILGTAGVLAVALVVGVVLVIIGKTGGNDPVSGTTVGIQTESTQQATGEEITKPSAEQETTDPAATQETTDPAATQETTMPDKTDSTTETTGTEQTTSGDKNTNQNGNSSSGTGFTDDVPQGPTTTVTPSNPTTPKETEPEPTETMAPGKPVQEYTYKEYMALSKSEKTAFYKKFPTLGDFNRWYNAAKKAHDDEKLVIGDSNIDLGDLLKP